jgi:hypothetical protein
MGSPRSAMVILIAALLLTPSARSTPVVDGQADCAQTLAAHVVNPCLLPFPTSGPASVSSFSPWRHRRKAVLEETNPRILEESDLGAVICPSEFTRSEPSEPHFCGPLSPVPLRC